MKLIVTAICLLFGLTAVANADPVSATIAAIAAPTITGAITRVALSLAISFVTNKLFAPEAPSEGDFQSAPDPGTKQRIPTDTNNKLPVVYGQARVFGTITHAAISSDNQRMAFIIPLAEGPVARIGTPGADTVTRGLFWDDYELRFDGDISTASRNIINAIDKFGTGAVDEFLNGNISVRAYPRGGRCSEMETFDPTWAANASERTMPNVAYLYVQLKYDREDGVTGLSSKFGANITGRTVRTFQTGTTLSSTESYSNNPAECLIDYLTNERYGCGGNDLITDADLDLTTFRNHHDYCDTMVPHITNGATVNAARFALNGVANTHDSRDMIISDMCTNSQSVFSYQLGQFQMNSDRALTSGELSATPIFDNDRIFGDITVINDGFNSQLNQYTASFISKDNLYQDDQIFLEIPSNLKNTNEPEFVQDARLKFIDNNVHGERLGYTTLRKSRDALVISFSTDIRALSLQVNDVIRITNETYGFTGKAFRINSVSETELDGGLLGFQITAQEYNALAYIDDTTSPFTSFAVAPNTTLPNPRRIPAVNDLTFSNPDSDNNHVTLSWTYRDGLAESYDVLYQTSETQITSPAIVNANLLTSIILPNGGAFPTTGTALFTVSNIPNSPFVYLWVRARNSYSVIGEADSVEIAPFGASVRVNVTQAQNIFVYNRSAIKPTTAPTEDYTYNFTTMTGVFPGNAATSNGWSTAIPSGNDTLWEREAIVTNVNTVVKPAQWSLVKESDSQPISVASFNIYRSQDVGTTTAPARPTTSSYTFSTNTFVGIAPWTLEIPTPTLTDRIYTSRVTVSTTSPNNAVNINQAGPTSPFWGVPTVFQEPSYEIFAYAARYVETDGTIHNPRTPGGTTAISRGVVTSGVFVTAPDRFAGDDSEISWKVSLSDPGLDLTEDVIYRSTALVTGGIVGTWSTPALFLLRGARGPNGLTNVIRYGAFESDTQAVINRPTSVVDGLNTNWFSNPDLLGVDSNNNPVAYTHTTQQFGEVDSGGIPYTSNHSLEGTIPTGSIGELYNREVTFTGTAQPTSYAGQSVSPGFLNVTSNVTAIDSENDTGPSAVWTQTDQGQASRPRGWNLPLQNASTTTDSISNSNNRRIAVRIRIGSTDYYAKFLDTLGTTIGATAISPQDAWLRIIDNYNGTGTAATVYSFTTSSTYSIGFGEPGYIFSGRFRNADGDDVNRLNSVLLSGANSDIGNITEIEIGYTSNSNSESGRVGFNSFTNGQITYSSPGVEWNRDWQYDFDNYRFAITSLSVGSVNINYPNEVWEAGEVWSVWFARQKAAAEALPEITSVNITSGTNYAITFSNTLAGNIAATYSRSNGAYSDAVVTHSNPIVSAINDLAWSYTFEPTWTDFLDESDTTTFGRISAQTTFRYSDSYTNEPIIGNYSGTETTLDQLLIALKTRLEALNHISVVNVTNDARIEIIYDGAGAQSTYTNPETGANFTANSGRPPNPFLNLGYLDNDSEIVNNWGISYSEGRGIGTHISGGNSTYVGFSTPIFFGRDPDVDARAFYIDSSGVSILQQIINAANTLFYHDNTNIFNTEIVGNTVRIRTNVSAVNPYDLTDPNDTDGYTWENDVLGVYGTGFTNNDGADSLGSAGDAFDIIVTRSRSGVAYDETTLGSTSINLNGSITLSDIVTIIENRAQDLGIYINRFGTPTPIKVEFQLQDVGTSSDEITLTLTSLSGLSLNLIGTPTKGEAPTLKLYNAMLSVDENVGSFQENRWTRPVNTGRQV